MVLYSGISLEYVTGQALSKTEKMTTKPCPNKLTFQSVGNNNIYKDNMPGGNNKHEEE